MTGFLIGLVLGSALTAVMAVRYFNRRIARLGLFFSFAIHEINTPITAVNMTILNFLGGIFGTVAAAQVPWMEMIREQTARLGALAGEMRDLVHIEFQKGLPIEIESMAVAEAVEKAVKVTAQGFINAGVKVNVSMPSHLPEVKADPDRFARTLISLLFYGRKFRLSGDIDVAARLRNSRQMELQVKFMGQKLSARQVARSLELFYPAEADDNHGMTASGLGLGLLRRVCRAQGGELEFKVKGDGESQLNLILNWA